MDDTIFKYFEKGHNIFLSGQAGTGKTYTIKKIMDKCEEKDLNCEITSSTAISALSIDGITINKFLGCGISKTYEEYKKYNKSINKDKKGKIKERLINIDLLIVDEVSMLSGTFIDMMDEIMRKIRNIDKPFGGCQIIFTGDFLQLPPVNKNNTNNIDWAFKSNSWKNANFVNLYLWKIYRQTDEDFMKILRKIRLGICDNDVKNYIFNLKNNKTNIKITKIFSRTKNVEEINKNELDKINSKLEIYSSIVTGNEKDIKKLIKSMPVEENLYLKVGARIMTTINDPQNRFYNGSLGTIIKLADEYISVKFDSEEIVHLKQYKWEERDDKLTIVATASQYPIKLAYAITIHKSQGMTIDGLEIDCKGIFETGQFYVALSRAKNPKNLIVKNFDKKYIKVNKEIFNFYNQLDKIDIK